MSKKKLIAIIAAVLAVVIAVSALFFVKNKKTDEEETTTEAATETTTVAPAANDAWIEGAEDFIYNTPSYLTEYPESAWTPPHYGGLAYQLLDVDFDEIPEILIYTQGVSGSIFLMDVFSFNGQKYTQCEISGFSMETAEGMGMINAYSNNETGETVFRAGDLDSELLSSDDIKSRYHWSYFRNNYVSREFTFANGVLSCEEYSNEELLEDLISEILDDASRYEELKNIREKVKEFEKKYSLEDEYKNTFVNVYSTEEFEGDENSDVLDIYHTYVDETFAKEFIEAYNKGEKELVLPVNAVT